MEHVRLIHIVYAVVGLLLYWYPKMLTVQIKHKDDFSYKFFFKENSILIQYTIVGTVALLLVVPVILEYFDTLRIWNEATAMGCGASNIYITKLLKASFESKAKKIIDKDEKNEGSDK